MSPSKTTLSTGTTAHTGAIFAVSFLEDSTLSKLTGLSSSSDSISGVTFPKGLTIYGPFSAVTLATGKALLYYSHNQ